jgi:NitT/TauT family transport system permease protein
MSVPNESSTANVSRSIWAACLPAALVGLASLLLWEAAVRYWQLPRILLPSPVEVARAAWDERDALWRGSLITGAAALFGLLLAVFAGTLVAILFSQSRWLRTAFYPYVIFLQTVPIVAIAPLLITWSGYRFRTVILVVAIISLFPIVSNVTAGLMSIDRNLLDLHRLYGAGRWQVLRGLRIPTAIGYLVLGLRISGGLAVIGAIVGEFFVGNGTSYDGLGTLMTGWQARQRTDALMAAVGASTILGVAMFALINGLSGRWLRRWIPATH